MYAISNEAEIQSKANSAATFLPRNARLSNFYHCHVGGPGAKAKASAEFRSLCQRGSLQAKLRWGALWWVKVAAVVVLNPAGVFCGRVANTMKSGIEMFSSQIFRTDK